VDELTIDNDKFCLAVSTHIQIFSSAAEMIPVSTTECGRSFNRLAVYVSPVCLVSNSTSLLIRLGRPPVSSTI
jgi:hypothetical protein